MDDMNMQETRKKNVAERLKKAADRRALRLAALIYFEGMQREHENKEKAWWECAERLQGAQSPTLMAEQNHAQACMVGYAVELILKDMEAHGQHMGDIIS